MWLWRLVGFNFRASTGLGKQTLGSVQFSSVSQSCLTLCDPMDSSTPGLPVHHQLLDFTQTHVHWAGDAIQPSHPLSSPSPPTFNLSQHQGLGGPKQNLAPWKKSCAIPRQHIKKQRHYFANKVLYSQSYGFPVVIYGCESLTIKKAEHQRIDAFKLWCLRRLLWVP